MGVRVYLGAFVTAEVIRRGLPSVPASEKVVRDSLRQQGGMDALAMLALPTIHGILAAQRWALIDAVYCAEERMLYEREFGERLVTLALETSRFNRSQRLSLRNQRPLSLEELEERDRYELDRLGIARVMAGAHRTIGNDGTLPEFENALSCFARGLGGGQT